MTFPQDILDVLVVSTEAEVFSVYACPYYAAYNVIHIVCSRTFTNMNMYTSSGFLESVLE